MIPESFKKNRKTARHKIVEQDRRAGFVIKAIRLKRRLSQEALGERIGLPRSTVARLENGDDIMHYGHICLFAEAFRMAPNHLVRTIEQFRDDLLLAAR